MYKKRINSSKEKQRSRAASLGDVLAPTRYIFREFLKGVHCIALGAKAPLSKGKKLVDQESPFPRK